jgi:hypothetical protein
MTADEQHRALLHAKLMETVGPELVERELRPFPTKGSLAIKDELSARRRL